MPMTTRRFSSACMRFVLDAMVVVVRCQATSILEAVSFLFVFGLCSRAGCVLCVSWSLFLFCWKKISILCI